MNNRQFDERGLNVISFEDRLKSRRKQHGLMDTSGARVPDRFAVSLAEATWTEPCATCGRQPEPMKVQGGYVRRECLCEWEARQSWGHAQFLQECAAKEAEQQRRESASDACYTWLGEDYSEYGLDGLTFENFHVRLVIAGKLIDVAHESDRQYAKDQAMLYAQSLDGNVIFNGGFGLGKTHLACAILNAQRALGRPGLFTTGQNLFNALLACNDDAGAKQRIITKMYSTPLLVIDDPDHATSTDFRINTYKEIFNKRYNRGLPTVITTNLTFGKNDDALRLKDVIGGAAADRLNKGLRLIGMRGESVRKYMVSE